MTFDEYAEAHLREAKEQTRLLRKLCAALALHPERAAERKAAATALDGSTAAAFGRRRNRKLRAG